MQFNLIGFNCRKYDNHMLYARMIGYSNEQLFDLSQKIVEHKGGANPFFGEAYNISYTDVYDFCSKKQSLKKWEIELGIHHKELGLPWDKPVPEEKWEQVAEYCDNDVIATEAVFEARQADFNARKMLVKLVEAVHGIKMSVNDTTNTLSTKLIFGKNKFPQGEFNWRDLSKPVSPEIDMMSTELNLARTIISEFGMRMVYLYMKVILLEVNCQKDTVSYHSSKVTNMRIEYLHI